MLKPVVMKAAETKWKDVAGKLQKVADSSFLSIDSRSLI
jgi:hypothetical protein